MSSAIQVTTSTQPYFVDARFLRLMEGSEDQTPEGSLAFCTIASALKASDYAPTQVNLEPESVAFVQGWLKNSIAICRQIIEEDGLESELAAVRNTYHPTPENFDEAESLLKELMAIEQLALMMGALSPTPSAAPTSASALPKLNRRNPNSKLRTFANLK